MIKNAIVLMFDSLQHNYLGCYGNDWIKTPNYDRFAREGVVFENCYIEGLPTVPCRRAMMTGRYTLPVAGWVPLNMNDTTIADLCWGRPIDTALIYDTAPMRLTKFGYSRGFDKVWFNHGHEADADFYAGDPLYHDNPDDYIEDHFAQEADAIHGSAVVEPLRHELTCYLKQTQYWRTADDRYVAKTLKKATEYLEQVDRNKQFFLWIDSFDPHEPWNPPSVYLKEPCPYDPDFKGKDQFLPLMGDVSTYFTEPELHHIRMLYAELVTVCDHYLGKFMDDIRRLGFEENTLMLIVSDHGEPMGNGEHGHGIMRKCRPWPYEELVHAPMLLRAPGIKAGQRIKSFVQNVDVAPTVCDWLGIGVHPDMQGFSLLPLVRGEVEKVRDFAIAGYWNYSWAIFTEDYSYIHWLNEHSLDKNNSKYMMGFFMVPNADVMGSAGKSDDPNAGAGSSGVDMSVAGEVMEMYQKAASLDGEAQWTCTPGSIAQLPEKDELYDRKKDKWQLNNILDKNPDKGRELLAKLRNYMSDLRAS